ncbi:hypothetical protein ACHQM5_012051 [Ranunculus cassubicifolius]
MIMVAIMAEMMAEYTVLLGRVLEQVFHDAPFPRRMRFLILRNLPFTSGDSSHFHVRLPPPIGTTTMRGAIQGAA